MKIDFHILEDANKMQAMLYTCKLVEDLHAENQHVYIHAASKDDAAKLDNLLWTYKDDSFIPHQLASEEAIAPVIIGHETPDNRSNGTLINCQDQLPSFYQQFNHVIEVVYSDATVQQSARERYRQYRDAGIELTTHKLKANAL